MATSDKARPLFDLPIVGQATIDSFKKLTPRRQVRNPVMFVVYVGSILTTLLWGQALVTGGRGEVHRALREFRRGHGVGSGQGPGGIAPQGTARSSCQAPRPARADGNV